MQGAEARVFRQQLIFTFPWGILKTEKGKTRRKGHNIMKESAKIKVVLVGIGGYGSIYINEVLRPETLEMIELVGIVDPYPESCRRLDELRAIAGEPYADINDFYTERSADLAVISTPIQFHTSNIITALEHGSDVLCEKPLCGDVRDVPVLLEAEKNSGRRVHIGYQWSHSAAIEALKRDVIAGVYGEPTSLKTLILWPRDKRYFKRGTGWAGKIRAADGALIYDSVANNAAAHYLHNMLYVTGASVDESRPVTDVTAELYRVNSIENFDTSVIRCKLAGGADATFIASHTIDKSQNPMFDYKFTNGRVTYTQDPVPEGISDADAYTRGHIVGVTSTGEVRDYGDPFYEVERKFRIARATAAGEDGYDVVCGVKAASEHTKVINYIGENYGITEFAADRIREQGELLYVDGLADRLIAIYDGRADRIE